MSDPYIGEIRMFGGNFAPAGWAFCDGQLLPISENDALFTLLGTMYGGDGQETFGIPDLRGRLPMHFNGNHPQAEMSGVESVTLTTQQMPVHNHAVLTAQAPGSTGTPSGSVSIADEGPAGITTIFTYKESAANQIAMNSNIVGVAGGQQPHNNIQPTLAISYIISLFGIFPTQT
jgi:microcystin-dependent protein